MPDDQSDGDVPTGYWVAFGYQNHVLPTKITPREDGKVAAPCGALVRLEGTSDKDDRAVCAWCGDLVRAGRIRIVPKPTV
ncbi:hypothetical protein ACH347_18010 [Saccharopolyspora sp. 5N102]|uniref:hypothetical protein n=1 Tax=Saccharopolyspora sp. 5N102 TaxID=3375155 RepID=UPI0037A57402